MDDGQLIVFDLDGTLVDQKAAAARWVDEFIRGCGADPDLRPWIIGELTARRPKDQVFPGIVERTSARVDPYALWQEYRRRMPELIELFPGVVRALRDLRGAGWMLGIATNGIADNQVGKIERTGLDALVDDWVVSSDVGIRKPDPGLVIVLAERIGVPLRGWMAGDGLETDIEAGRRAGLRTAWITDRPHADAAVDLVVGDVPGFAAAVLNR
ncbi:MAG: hypothetical protein BGN97_14420 [Microbacterium sp. 69-10]|nr:MAG: hypothetical protein BGN97_14420 [Microbacterium sp. 69-10]